MLVVSVKTQLNYPTYINYMFRPLSVVVFRRIIKLKMTGNVRINVILRRVHVTTFTMENKKVLRISVCVCVRVCVRVCVCVCGCVHT